MGKFKMVKGSISFIKWEEAHYGNGGGKEESTSDGQISQPPHHLKVRYAPRLGNL